MGTIFSETLTKLRLEAGFRTAYQFYHGNGGAHVLKVSYRRYLAFEQGMRFPLFKRLGGLLFGLRAPKRSQAGKELVISWLKTMAGDVDYTRLLGNLIDPKNGFLPFSPESAAISQALSGQKYSISAEQFNAIAGNRDNYLCYLALVNDEGKWSPAELAKFLKLTPAAAAKAMEALAKVKILKKDRAGRYKCPLCGKLIEYPHYNALNPAKRGKLHKYLEELSAAGILEWERLGTLRADADTMREFMQIMQLNISTAQTYAVTKKTDKSALFSIRGSVTRLRDF